MVAQEAAEDMLVKEDTADLTEKMDMLALEAVQAAAEELEVMEDTVA